MSERSEADRLTEEDTLRLLADPAQEVLVERRPQFSQLAPVPVLDTDCYPEAARYPAFTRYHRRD